MKQEMIPSRENKGLRLLKRGKKGLARVLFSRTGLVTVLLLLQVAVLFMMFWRFSAFLPHFYGATAVFTLVMVLTLLNDRGDPTSKITWLAIIMVAPVFGSLLYLYTRNDVGHRALKKRIQDLIIETRELTPQQRPVSDALEERDPGAAGLADYLRRSGYFPTYQNTAVWYFPSGEEKFRSLLVELEQAKDFIFLEYFILEEGDMWGQILDILARKAGEGVDVRVMYDGTCEFTLLPRDYPRRMKALGIQCKVFAPVTPFVSTHYNYRDHRKILVIDGQVAFTGGVNLADEYINRKQRFGHWKDTAVMLKGDAVRTFTLLFLQMWSITEKNGDFQRFMNIPVQPQPEARGFVVPYGTCPLDERRVGRQVYMDLLSRAQTYVHIMTPYLILDGELENALKYAAERGVDVRLILPGIPDKKTAYALAKTHYLSLLDSGVRIYEYTPGFVHAKVMVSDDREAVVGTINLDYRSLYHHFECAAWMYETDCIGNIETDFLKTMNQCRRVTRKTIREEKKFTRLLGWALKVIAPLL